MRKRSLRVADVAGEAAWKDGLFPEDNPYRDGTPERLTWEQAYHRAGQAEKEHRAFMARLRREDRARKKAKAADGGVSAGDEHNGTREGANVL